MSDRDGDEADEEGEDPHLDTEETSGLGLTDEFARIESEIESATGEHPPQPADGGETGDAGAAGDPEDPAAEAPAGDDESTSEWDTVAETGDQEWVVDEEGTGETGSGSWETGEYDADHDTGEWITDCLLYTSPSPRD